MRPICESWTSERHTMTPEQFKWIKDTVNVLVAFTLISMVANVFTCAQPLLKG
jgi:hypothetical protein